MFLKQRNESLKDFYRITDLEQQDEFEKAKGEAETLAEFIWKQRKTYRDLDKKSTLEQFVLPLNQLIKRIKRVKVTLPNDEKTFPLPLLISAVCL